MTQQQQWIHAQDLVGKSVADYWYSPSPAISASRSPDSVEYRDSRLQYQDSYNPQQQVLERFPDTQAPRNRYEGMLASIAALVKQERTLDNPLDVLDFLGKDREKWDIIDHDQQWRKVIDEGHEWLDYRLTVKHSEWNEPLQMHFRVDAVTKAPRLFRFESGPKEKWLNQEIRFDYPENGPASIYDLEVPKTATIVDNMPTGDLKSILEALRAGSAGMDDYRCVLVDQSDGPDYMWWTNRPEIKYRKGDKFRSDAPTGWTGDEADYRESPGQIEDLGRYWRERAKHFHFFSHYVMDDSTSYTAETENVRDADGSEHPHISAVNRHDWHSKPGHASPIDYASRPEFACRPSMGIGRKDFQPVLNLNPTEGPPGCILLSLLHTTKKGRIDERGFGSADEIRYWLDPERDYIVMRWDQLLHDDAGTDELYSSTTIEEVARSPRGVWYATRIRSHHPRIDKMNGKRIDGISHLFVDFDVDLPDALFEPPVPGRIR